MHEVNLNELKRMNITGNSVKRKIIKRTFWTACSKKKYEKQEIKNSNIFLNINHYDIISSFLRKYSDLKQTTSKEFKTHKD